MNYTVSLLSNKPDCQALLDIANTQKEGLQYRKTGLQRQKQTATITGGEIEVQLTSLNVEIDALQAVHDSLPEGTTRVETLRNLKKAQYRKFLLEQRKTNYGVLSLLAKEYDIACIDDEINETDAFIAAVTARMAEVN